MSLNKPSGSEYQSVGRYLNNRKALGEEEATWIQHKEDLITLRTGRDHAWLDDIVEGFLKLCHCKLIDVVFRSKVRSPHSNKTSTIKPRPSRLVLARISIGSKRGQTKQGLLRLIPVIWRDFMLRKPLTCSQTDLHID
jgi:hypothetical protein